MNILGHLPEAIFSFAQCLLRPPALVGQKAVSRSVQGLAYDADDRA
jgi:hypothetical protein